MPDKQFEQLLVRVLATCGLLSAVIVAAAAVGALLFFGRKWQRSHQALATFGGTLGVGTAFYLGCGMLNLLPRWKPSEVDTRFLYLLLPANFAIELLAALPSLPRWIPWVLRVILAAGAAPLLLHGSVYLPDQTSVVDSEWTPEQTYLILAGMAASLVAVWVLLAYLTNRTGDCFVPLALTGTCGGAAVTIMLSGYLSGGELGLPLASALGGAALAALVLLRRSTDTGLLGVGIVGLFGLLILGRFFGNLTSLHAASLFAAPLLCWLPEVWGVRRLWPWARGCLRLVLVLLPIGLVLARAQEKFAEQSKSSSGAPEPSKEDYMDFQP